MTDPKIVIPGEGDPTPDPTPKPDYSMGDSGILNSNGEEVLSSDLLSSSDYKVDNGKLFNNKGEEVPITKDLIDDIISSQSTPDSIEIDGESYVLNENGDALKEDGSIFMSKEDIDKFEAEPEYESVEIDGNTYKLDDKGNALSEDGEIFMSKKDIDKLSEIPEGIGIKDIIKSVNVDISDRDGNPVEYEDTPEGVAKYINDVISQSIQAKAMEVDSNLINEFPVLGSVVDYLRHNNGSLDGFSEYTDYSSVSIDDKNESQLDNLILTARMAKGDSKEEAERYLRYVADDNKKVEDAKSSLKYLQTKQSSEKAAYDEAIANQQREERERAENYWGLSFDASGNAIPNKSTDSIYHKIINDGKLSVDGKEVALPENIKVRDGNGSIHNYSKEDFFDYMYRVHPIKLDTGEVTYLTRYQLDTFAKNSKRTVDNDIFDAFLTFTGGDNSQLIEKQIEEERVRRIRKLTSGKVKRVSSAPGSGTRKIKLPTA